MSSPQLLLVEDDAWLAELYSDSLTAAGFSVQVAASAEAALTQLDTQPQTALIVLDMFLPDHNGIEFLHELASYTDINNLPVVVLSAVPARDFAMPVERWKHYGVVEYLYKPQTKPDQLVAAVKSHWLRHPAVRL